MTCGVEVQNINYENVVSFRYWEAVKKWDEAIQLTPEEAVLYEMKSQVWVSQTYFKY